MDNKIKRKPINYWTYEKVQEEAKKYNTRSEFKKGCESAYYKALNNDWIDDITKHMVKREIKPKGYWTYEKVEEEAKKYNKKVEFCKDSNSAYLVAFKNGWLDDITKHMIRRKKNQHGYWTYDKLQEEAKKYDTYTEFQRVKRYAVEIAKKNGWLLDITKHMTNSKVEWDRIIYSFQFPDKSVYVGLTKHDDIRYKEHTMYSKRSAVYKYIKKTGLIPKFVKETDFLSEEESVKMETYFENLYRQNGWKVLNIAKTGSLGGCFIKWTYDTIKEEAKKYNKRGDFMRESSTAYEKAAKNGWLPDITKHMGDRKPRGYWTYGKVEEEAKKYNTKAEFSKGSHSSYYAALKNGWIDDITKHMVRIEQKPKGYWTYEKVEEEAKKYNTRWEFRKGCSSAYSSALKNEWVDDVTKHMVRIEQKPRGYWTYDAVYIDKKPKGYWTYEKVEEEAKKYNTRWEFRKGSSSAYMRASNKNWLDSVTKHMVQVVKPNNYWTYDKVEEEAKKYNTRLEFSKGCSSAYSSALKNEWIDDVTKHMVYIEKKPRGYWTYDKVEEEAKKYNTRLEFQKKSPSAYRRARKSGWLDDVAKHMAQVIKPSDKTVNIILNT
jgi:hypothetical protein